MIFIKINAPNHQVDVVLVFVRSVEPHDVRVVEALQDLQLRVDRQASLAVLREALEPNHRNPDALSVVPKGSHKTRRHQKTALKQGLC